MIITVASGNGETGKTTFAVNLSYALAQRGESTRLLVCPVDAIETEQAVTGDWYVSSTGRGPNVESQAGMK